MRNFFKISFLLFAAALFALWINFENKISNLWAIILPRQIGGVSASMEPVHVKYGVEGEYSDFYIPEKYLVGPLRRDLIDPIFVRISLRKLIESEVRQDMKFDVGLASDGIADTYDIVDIALRGGRPGAIDRSYKFFKENDGWFQIKDDYFALKVFKPTDKPGYKGTDVYLVPNDYNKYPDTYFTQATGLGSANQCTEYTLIKWNLSAEIRYSFGKIGQWELVDRAVRRLVSSFLIEPSQVRTDK